MQTKLAFIFVLHVLGLGVILARTGGRLRVRNLMLVFGYLFVFYAAWGAAMNAMPSIYVPDGAGAGKKAVAE